MCIPYFGSQGWKFRRSEIRNLEFINQSNRKTFWKRVKNFREAGDTSWRGERQKCQMDKSINHSGTFGPCFSTWPKVFSPSFHPLEFPGFTATYFRVFYSCVCVFFFFFIFYPLAKVRFLRGYSWFLGETNWNYALLVWSPPGHQSERPWRVFLPIHRSDPRHHF